MLGKLSAACGILLVTATAATAGDFQSMPDTAEPPKVGLVLAGGGARGAAHVGVIRVLEEVGIRPDFIAGTSMGAIVGGLYAAGLDAAHLEQVLSEMDWDHVLSDDSGRASRSMRRKQLESRIGVSARIGFDRGGLNLPMGVLQAQHFDQILTRILGPSTLVEDFDHLPIPFRAVATDLEIGDPVILASGSLVQAIRASMSVPAIFAPVFIDGLMLVDGGVAMNTPVEVVQAMGADVLIVVDLSPTPRSQDALDSILRITDQLTLFLTLRNTRQSLALLGEGDIVISPDLGDITSTQFERSLEAAAAGELAARRELGTLTQLAARLPSRPPPEPLPAPDPVIGFIEITNMSRVSDALVRSRLTIRVGDELDHEEIERSLAAIHGLDIFDAVRYSVVKDPERGTGLIINAEGRTWGPNYLQLGLGLATDFESIQDFNLTALFSRNAVHDSGAAISVGAAIGRFSGISANYYQPLDRLDRWFIQPGIAWNRDRRDLFDETVNLGTLQFQRWGPDLMLGRNFGTSARAGVKLAVARENITAVRGLQIPEQLADIGAIGRIARGEATGFFILDTLDDLHFPRQGRLIDLSVRRSDSALDADIEFTQYQLAAVGSTSWREWSLVGRGLIGISSREHLPVSDQFRLGGFGTISGLPFGALVGEQAALASLSSRRLIADLRLLPIYAGASIEAGNVWRDRSDMSLSDLRYGGSLYLGIDSLLGPIFLAAGIDDDGNKSLYFVIGNPFELRMR